MSEPGGPARITIEPFAGCRDELIAIELACFDEPWGAQAFGSALDSPRYGVWSARTPDGVLCGYALGARCEEQAEVHRVAVMEHWRGQGLGARLLGALLDAWRTDGVRSVLLEVRADNAPALALYASAGFTRLISRRAYYRDGTDALVLEARLEPR